MLIPEKRKTKNYTTRILLTFAQVPKPPCICKQGFMLLCLEQWFMKEKECNLYHQEKGEIGKFLKESWNYCSWPRLPFCQSYHHSWFFLVLYQWMIPLAIKLRCLAFLEKVILKMGLIIILMKSVTLTFEFSSHHSN